jgi:methanogenic corrinoid protein MtbC1
MKCSLEDRENGGILTWPGDRGKMIGRSGLGRRQRQVERGGVAIYTLVMKTGSALARVRKNSMTERVFDPQCLRLIALLRQGATNKASMLVSGATARQGAEWSYLKLLIPSVYALGELFVSGELDGPACDQCVADVLRIMGETRGKLSRRAAMGRKVFASFLPGHAHSVGFIAISHWLERDGWDVELPSPVPPEKELVERIVASRPDVIALTCSVPRNVVQARRIIRSVRGRGVKVPVWVGGMPINALPGLFERTGADRTAKDIVAFSRALGEQFGYETMTGREWDGVS